MIEDWDIPAARPAAGGTAPNVAAVIPLPIELGGAGELLVLAAFGNMKLPSGEIQPRETSLRAVSRVALGATGVTVTPERLVYVVEQSGKPLTLCVLCAIEGAEEIDTKPGVRFAKVAGSDAEFDPAPLRELLIEDLAAGFVRGIAHVAISFDDAGRERATVTW